MRHPTKPIARAITKTLAPLLVLAAVLTACGDGSDPLAPETQDAPRAEGLFDDPGVDPFEVMTRNVYLGGNTAPVFAADFSDPVAVVTAAAQVWAEVLASEIPARAREIVEEIGRERPHVVSLQEAFRFQRLDGGLTIDWIEALEAEIALQGLDYEVAAVQTATQATLPVGFPVGPSTLVRFTDRIAVLVRDDVEIDDIDSGIYDARVPLGSTPFGDVVVERGWIRLATEYRNVPHHVVATHLEVQSIAGGAINVAQGVQLRDEIAADLDGLTVIAGDLNSDAAGSPGDPSWTPTYGNLIADGFVDGWLQSPAAASDPGLTCCHDDDLLNPTTDFDQRLDFVLVRTGSPPPGFLPSSDFDAEILGEELADRLASGRWPSDHAALSVAIWTPTMAAGR